MSARWLWCLCALLMLLAGGQSWGQAPQTFASQQAREEDLLIRQLEGEIPTTQGALFDWGGWYRPSYTHWDDIDRTIDLVEHDFRLWTNFSFDQVHQAYFRVRTAWVNFYGDDAFDGNNFDTEGPNLDVGWYRMDVTGAARRYFSTDLPFRSEVKAGRQYLQVGTGMVLSQILDGVRLDGGVGLTDATLFVARSVHSQDSLDLTLPGHDESDRRIAALEIKTRVGDGHHEPFVYALITRDHTGERPEDPSQEFTYDADYYGFGSTGSVIPDLRYWAEFSFQRGKSFPSGSTAERERIHAFGYDVGTDYFFTRLPLRARIGAEIAHGEGDPDRGSPTNTIGGNTLGTDDEGFLPFGYIDTGSAFAARLANLNVVRVGFSFHPLDFNETFRELELGTSYYWFRKGARTGGITDPSADLAHSNLGKEIDFYANWRVLSDLLLTLRWGHFMPGEAYSDRSSRDYFLGAVIYSF